jgi:hypothetical protein
MTEQAAIAFKSDVFAEIAVERRVGWGKHQTWPKPAKLKPRTLPAMGPAKAAGPKRSRVDTPGKLERALAQSRRSPASRLV